MSEPRTERPILAPDLAGAVAQAGGDPTLEGRALQDALRRAIASRRGYCTWDVDHTGWVVTWRSPGVPRGRWRRSWVWVRSWLEPQRP